MTKSIREIYMEIFSENEFTISDIKKFLKHTYGIELKKHLIDVSSDRYWKYNLENKIKDIRNIVYINCYKDSNGKTKPFICGVTKTGVYGTTDFNFNKHANKDRQNYLISGRAFLCEKDFDYDKSVIYLFGCTDKFEAYILERDIQYRFHLFGS